MAEALDEVRLTCANSPGQYACREAPSHGSSACAASGNERSAPRRNELQCGLRSVSRLKSKLMPDVATSYRYIVRTPGVRGGNARVEGTRIGVHDVVAYHLLGNDVDTIRAALVTCPSSHGQATSASLPEACRCSQPSSSAEARRAICHRPGAAPRSPGIGADASSCRPRYRNRESKRCKRYRRAR